MGAMCTFCATRVQDLSGAMCTLCGGRLVAAMCTFSGLVQDFWEPSVHSVVDLSQTCVGNVYFLWWIYVGFPGGNVYILPLTCGRPVEAMLAVYAVRTIVEMWTVLAAA